MPSAYTSRPHLSCILGLEPTREPRCVGYDILRGRRDIAETFLDMATTQFRAGRRADYFLEVIAPRVLCRGVHRRLVHLLVGRWERELAAVEAHDHSPRPLSEGYTYGAGYGYGYGYGHEDHAEPGMDSRRKRIYQRIQDTVQELRGRIRDIHLGGICPDLSSFAIFSRGRYSTVAQREHQSHWSFYYDPASDYYYRPYIDPIYTFEPLYAEPSPTEPPAPAPISEARRQPVEGDCSICLSSLLESVPTDFDSNPWKRNAADSEPSSGPYNDWYQGWGWWNYIPDSQGRDQVNGNEDEERECQFASVSWCRAKCGVNFHTSCIDRWLYMADRSTCPVCRSYWVFG